MTGDTKTSVYILKGDASQDKCVARASALYGIGGVRTKARLSGRAGAFQNNTPTSPRQRLGYAMRSVQ